jgi:hypothetical protein
MLNTQNIPDTFLRCKLRDSEPTRDYKHIYNTFTNSMVNATYTILHYTVSRIDIIGNKSYYVYYDYLNRKGINLTQKQFDKCFKVL